MPCGRRQGAGLEAAPLRTGTEARGAGLFLILTDATSRIPHNQLFLQKMLCWILGFCEDTQQGVRAGKLTGPQCCPCRLVWLPSGNLARSPSPSARAVPLETWQRQPCTGGLVGFMFSPSLLGVHSVICSTTHWRSCTPCLASARLLWKRWLQKERLLVVWFCLLKGYQVKMPRTSGQRQKKCKRSWCSQAWTCCWCSHHARVSSQVGKAFGEKVCTTPPLWPIQLLL